MDSHTAFYFPPSASKDRAVNSMEIKDFIILWTYRQDLVVIPPLSPERETFRKLSFCQLLHSSPLLDRGIVKRLSINRLESRFTMLFNFIGYLICMTAPGLPVFSNPAAQFSNPSYFSYLLFRIRIRGRGAILRRCRLGRCSISRLFP